MKALGYVCRPASGACDAAETCDGVSSMCGADVLKSVGEVCRAAVRPTRSLRRAPSVVRQEKKKSTKK